MFKLDLSPTYFAPVSLTLLDADGKLQNHQFDARFNRLTELELQALQKRMDGGELDDQKVLDLVLVGWRGVVDADATPIPFNADSLAMLVSRVAGMRVALVSAYFASLKPTAGAVLAEATSD